MPSWGNYDNAANTPLWSVTQVNVTPDSANTALLFDNTVQDDWKEATTGGGYRHADQAVGVFGIDVNEAQVESGTAHTGWVLRTEFSGQRAGRVQEEVLVALSSMNNDSDSAYANTVLEITSQPSGNSTSKGAGKSINFYVTATSTPTAPITYLWQYNTASGSLGWTNAASSPLLFTGGGTSTLTANAVANTTNTYVVRVQIASPAWTSSANVVSSNATITITG